MIMLGDVLVGRVVDEALAGFPGHATEIWSDWLPLLRGEGSPVRPLVCDFHTLDGRWSSSRDVRRVTHPKGG